MEKHGEINTLGILGGIPSIFVAEPLVYLRCRDSVPSDFPAVAGSATLQLLDRAMGRRRFKVGKSWEGFCCG